MHTFSGFTLGLDLGPNSIGWALLANDPKTGEPCGFFDTREAEHPPMGVRVFEAGLANFDTSKEMSLNQKRRTARSMRRTHARRNARRGKVRELLQDGGLLPTDPQELEAVYALNPYETRARGLDDTLTANEIGRSIFHIGQRRGFQSNRKSGDAKEDEGILLEIGQLQEAIKEAGCRTLGEYLAHLLAESSPLDGLRLRKRHTRRDMYLTEFRALVAVQKKSNPNLLPNDLVQKLEHTIFFQHSFEISEERRESAPSRANLHRAPSVKPCPLEEGETGCPKSVWTAQKFRILKEVANLRVSEHFGQERDLRAEERHQIVDYLMGRERAKFDDLRKQLAKAGGDPDARFNLERGSRNYLLGNSVEAKLANGFGKKLWAAMSEDERHRYRDLILDSEDPDWLLNQLLDQGCPEDKAAKLVKWTPADGYLIYSLKAINKLLPYLESGEDEFQAIQKAYPRRNIFAETDYLLPLCSTQLPPEIQSITNPVVRRGLVELRKVVNAIIREHGLPDRIVVEMAREMKAGPEERKRQSRQNRERQELREEAARQVDQFGGNPNSRSDIARWLLWKEQDGLCLYTGQTIPVTELFRGGEWEVDHILPRWRSLDDSMMNKVLVSREANGEKGDRTPAEWLGLDSENYKALLRRAYMAEKKGFMPGAKYKKLATPVLKTDAFVARQLNDTRYISKVVVQYLELLYPPDLRRGEKAVQSSRGGLTAELRRSWGLNGILDSLRNADGKTVMSLELDPDGNPYKSRADHRHHAIDAVIVALSSRKLLKRYQDYWRERGRFSELGRPEFPVPWDSFRSHTKDFAEMIHVSHRVMRKISGALHEETFYGPTRDEHGNLVADRFVTRKTLEGLTGKTVRNIRDEAIRRIVSARLREKGWDGKSSTLPKQWFEEPLFMKSGVPIKKVRVEVPIKNAAQIKHRHAVLGNNHHIEVICSSEKDADGKPVQMWARVVPMMEVVDRVRRRKLDAVERDHGKGREFLMSLARKESVLAYNPSTGEQVHCVVQAMSGSTELDSSFDFIIRDARDSRPASEGNKSPFKRLKSFRPWKDLGLKKVQVDPLGRIGPAND